MYIKCLLGCCKGKAFLSKATQVVKYYAKLLLGI